MANLKRADRAIMGYAKKVDEPTLAQLDFFRSLWDEQASITEQLAPDYEAPDAKTIKRLSKEGRPVLRSHPAVINKQKLAQASSRMAATLWANGGYDVQLLREVEGIGWPQATAKSAHLAGRDPEACIEAALAELARTGLSDGALQVAASALSLALRALLEPAANAITLARSQAGVADDHQLNCPCCGCGATLASVGASTSTSGGARQLFCAQCGTAWSFDRIRCARCGTRNQGHLHYYSIEGDESHRIHTCDECGGYIRTVFQEDILAPISLDVEDVVMARLDRVAQSMGEKDAQE